MLVGHTGVSTDGATTIYGFNPDATGDNGSSYGLYQFHGARMQALFAKYGPHPTVEQQNAFAWEQLNDPSSTPLGTLKALRKSGSAGKSAFLWTRAFERPAGGVAAAELRAGSAELFMPQKPAEATIKGGANLHIRIDGAPAGTRVSSETYGNAFAGAPRVVMPMPAGGGPVP